MLILVLDCSGPRCSVGLWQDGTFLARSQEEMERGQDARLMPMIVQTLQVGKVSFSDLDRIAAVRGPGSFTGLRVVLATARGIGLAANKPVIGIDRFSIYRRLYSDIANLLVVIESKRAELFCKFFPETSESIDAELMTKDQIASFLKNHARTHVVGDTELDDKDVLEACAELAAIAIPDGVQTPPLPLYLRAPDVSFAGAKSL